MKCMLCGYTLEFDEGMWRAKYWYEESRLSGSRAKACLPPHHLPDPKIAVYDLVRVLFS